MNKPTNYYDMACDKFSGALCYGIRKNTTKADNVLEQISDEVNKLKKVSDGNSVYVGINDVFDIIDRHNVTIMQ